MPFRLYDPSSPGLSLMDYVLGAVCGMWRVADGGRCTVTTTLTVWLSRTFVRRLRLILSVLCDAGLPETSVSPHLVTSQEH